jgi:hypothetical protein
MPYRRVSPNADRSAELRVVRFDVFSPAFLGVTRLE